MWQGRQRRRLLPLLLLGRSNGHSSLLIELSDSVLPAQQLLRLLVTIIGRNSIDNDSSGRIIDGSDLVIVVGGGT